MSEAEERVSIKAQSLPLMMMIATDLNQGPLIVSLSPVKKSVISKSRICERLTRQTFLGSSHYPRLPCIMVEWTRWSMLVILTKEWLYTRGMRL